MIHSAAIGIHQRNVMDPHQQLVKRWRQVDGAIRFNDPIFSRLLRVAPSVAPIMQDCHQYRLLNARPG